MLLDSHLLNSVPGNSDEPCTDLLDLWKSALTQHDKSWEVVWSPAAHGTDKQMWVHFPDLRPRGDSKQKDESQLEKLSDWMNKVKGYTVVNRFSNDGGVTLMPSSPQHVDDILKMDRFNISALPGLSLKALRGRQIEVEHALELVILGVAREYNVNEVIEVLKRWLIRNFSVNEDAMPLHTLAGV